MRLFVGLEIDDAVRRRAGAIADGARALVSDTLVVRWIPPANLHITLWFLGEVAELRAPSVLTALDTPFALQPFDLQLRGLGSFPPSGMPRVVWIGIREGAQSLSKIHAELALRLNPLGFPSERRPFSPHLTIGRVKSARLEMRARDMRPLWNAVPADAGKCRIDAVTVFRSRLSPRGAAYEALLRVPLQ